MWGKLAKQWFLIALAICFAIGYLLARHVQPISEVAWLRSGIVFAVMWAMGFTLKADAIRQSLKHPWPSLLAILVNIFLVPVLCLPAIWLLSPEFAGGLFVAALVPCTLASAAVWTRKAGGEDSIALMTTVVTNLACVVVVPIGLSLMLSQQSGFRASDQMWKLGLVVVVPLVLAQLMRKYGGATWADQHKAKFSTFAQIGILVMVMFGAARSAGFVQQADANTTSWISVSLLVSVCAGVHVAALLVGLLIAKQTGCKRSHQIAVGIAGSQKTLMVGLQIAIEVSVSVVPMLVYHLSQLIIDTIIAAKWAANESQLDSEQTSDENKD